MTTRKISLARRLRNRWLADDGLTKKAYLNALAEALDYGARLIVGFVINPILVAGLGVYGYGAWQILGRLIGYLAPASGRPTQALKWTIANRQASTDFDEKRRQVGSAIAVWLLFLPLLTGLGSVLVWYTPIWLAAPDEYVSSVRIAAGLLVANLILISVVDLPRSVLTGENLGYKRMGLSALLVCVGGVLTATAVHLDTGLAGVAAATLATTLLTGVLFLWVARSHVPWFGAVKPSFEAARRFLKLSAWFLVWSLVMLVMRASDVVILGLLDSVESVTSYTLTKYVPETVINFVAIIVFGITPGLGGIIGTGDLPRAIRVRNELMSFTWLLVTVMGTTILLWNRSFVHLWVGAEHYVGSLATLLMIAVVAQFVLIRNDANIIDLTLDLRRKVLVGIVATTLSLLAAGILVGSFNLGIVGLCLGLMAGRTILSVSYPWLIGGFLGVPLAVQLRSTLRPGAVTLVLFTSAMLLEAGQLAATWPGLILAVALTVALVTLLAFFGGMSSGQRHGMLKRARMIRGSTNRT